MPVATTTPRALPVADRGALEDHVLALCELHLLLDPVRRLALWHGLARKRRLVSRAGFPPRPAAGPRAPRHRPPAARCHPARVRPHRSHVPRRRRRTRAEMRSISRSASIDLVARSSVKKPMAALIRIATRMAMPCTTSEKTNESAAAPNRMAKIRLLNWSRRMRQALRRSVSSRAVPPLFSDAFLRPRVPPGPSLALPRP